MVKNCIDLHMYRAAKGDMKFAYKKIPYSLIIHSKSHGKKSLPLKNGRASCNVHNNCPWIVLGSHY